jgi:protein TonB
MLISKFDLYKSEWLELVFAKRNKEYGAYYLRQHYAGNLLRAMGITFIGIISTALILGVLIKAKPDVMIRQTIVELSTYVQPPVPPKVEPKKIQAKASKPLPQVKTEKFVPFVVTSKPVTIDPPKIEDLKDAIGAEDVKAPGNGNVINIDPDAGKGDGGNGTAPVADNTVHSFVDIMPEPYGGDAAWAKFLQSNLKYPPQATEKGISGRVTISFVIEKDGRISTITVDRGAGFGLDEEAIRVLKLARPWKPGMQNGQPVRVKYTLPINFSMNQ